MWLATDLGVSKYNGYEFENYSFDTTLLDNAILKLYKAPDGKIWFISLNGYLAYYDYNNITPFERNNELAQYVKKHGRYTSFNITEDNEIYYITLLERIFILKQKIWGQLIVQREHWLY